MQNLYLFSLGNEHQDASLLVNNIEQKGNTKINNQFIFGSEKLCFS